MQDTDLVFKRTSYSGERSQKAIEPKTCECNNYISGTEKSHVSDFFLQGSKSFYTAFIWHMQNYEAVISVSPSLSQVISLCLLYFKSNYVSPE